MATDEKVVKQRRKRLVYVPKFVAKIVLLGDSCTGKSKIMANLAGEQVGTTVEPTVGAGYVRYKIPASGLDLKLFEISGQRAFHKKLCASIMTKHVDIVCIVYSTNNTTSLESMRLYWGPKLVSEGWLSETSRVLLVGNTENDGDKHQTNMELAKKTASLLAKTLNKKQIDFVEVDASHSEKVIDLFKIIGETAAVRSMTQLLRQLKKTTDVSEIDIKLMLRKSGFTEEFASKHQLEPLCCYMREITQEDELLMNDFEDGQEDSDCADSDHSTDKWVQLNGNLVQLFRTMKEAKKGASCTMEIALEAGRTSVSIVNGVYIELINGDKRLLLKATSKIITHYWVDTISSIMKTPFTKIDDAGT
uniref:Uncharacterized protein n=1 Tax=Spongospora subterranea TaxID=70186 RepID=A0A0H5QJQ6_9EUKA|eukprot:CRZ02238.1 hypothetical protein [Spongospora subterranea]